MLGAAEGLASQTSGSKVTRGSEVVCLWCLLVKEGVELSVIHLNYTYFPGGNLAGWLRRTRAQVGGLASFSAAEEKTRFFSDAGV